LNLIDKQAVLKNKFNTCSSKEDIYFKIIELGKSKVIFLEEWKLEEMKVPGCQSTVYLHVEYNEDLGTLTLHSCSDALISAGLAQLLVEIYSGEKAEDILRTPPSVLDELKIPSILTLGRANGLANMWKTIQNLALKLVISLEKKTNP
jgi:cysteine desulfuration protein SufE